jgi:predicted RNA-binding Zn ribbon-like protein
MGAATKDAGEWVDGFLFVGNRPILDFLNTRPVLAENPTELLPDVPALERWLIAAGIVNSAREKRLVKSWRNAPEAALFLKDLIAFRERLREAVLHLEGRLAPSDEFTQEVNRGLFEHRPATVLRKLEGRVIREQLLDLKRPRDLWALFFDGAADLLSEPEIDRIRQCEACVLHFLDTSKKGSRRWCSMNICGNKLKVAAYQRRKRGGESAH